MIKTNKNINYGAALTSLFEGLKYAETMANSENEYKYPNAYGRATMAIKMCLVQCTEMTFDDIDKELHPQSEVPTLARYEDNPDDIPTELFTQPNGYGGLAD